MSDYGSSTTTSPDGRYMVDYWEDEVRMGCWIRLPTITDQRDNRRLLALDGRIDSDVTFQFGLIAVRICGSFDGGCFALWLDPDQDIAWFEDDQQTKFPLADASAQASSRIERNGWSNVPRPQHGRQTPSPSDPEFGPEPADVAGLPAADAIEATQPHSRPRLGQAATALLAIGIVLAAIVALTMLAFVVLRDG